MLLRTFPMPLWNSRITPRRLHRKTPKSKSCSEISLLSLFGTCTKKKPPPLFVTGGSGGVGRRKIGCRGNGGVENEYDSEDWGCVSLADLYYNLMIQADPGNPLLLSNYARYLKEVRFDFLKAEEYCERAVMARADDGNILSLYAELKWEIHKDPVLAEHYFNLSVKASPEDCYVLASYANFLWNLE